MQSLHKKENLLFKDFQDFLVRSQQLPEKRIPYYLRWVSRFHEFCSRQHMDGMEKEAIASCLQGLAKHHKGVDGQINVRLVPNFFINALPVE